MWKFEGQIEIRGRRQELKIEIHPPQKEDIDWACKVEAIPLIPGGFTEVPGIDAEQAWTLSVRLIEGLIESKRVFDRSGRLVMNLAIPRQPAS